VTPKGQTRGPNTLMSATSRKKLEMLFSNNHKLLDSLLWGSTYGRLSWRQLGFLFLPRDAT